MNPNGPAVASDPVAVAVVRKVPTVLEALGAWLCTIVLFSAIGLFAPLLVPLAHTGKFDMTASFGKGELLGFALALFAAALSRWIAREGRGSLAISSFGLAGMFLSAMALSGVWLDGYQVATRQADELFFPESSVVAFSWILVVASLICGCISEVTYARSLRGPAVKVDPW